MSGAIDMTSSQARALGLGAAALALAAAPAGACEWAPDKLRYEDRVAKQCQGGADAPWPGQIKAVELNGLPGAVVGFGGEARGRYEYTRNPAFGAAGQDPHGVWLQRLSVFADVRLGPHVRGFVQATSAIEAGRAEGPSPVDENKLFLSNGFVDLAAPLDADARLTLRGGRQELQYGSGRLVDVREGPNVRRTFDAARVIGEAGGWRGDAFYARPRRSEQGVFDDGPDRTVDLWGLYLSGHIETPAATNLDLYYLGFKDDDGVFVQGAARELRHSLGARLWGDGQGWDWNLELVYQFGAFGRGDINAWTVASDAGYRPDGWSWRPRFGLSFNVASGDKDAGDRNLETFNPLFPRGNYFSEAAVLGPRNFFNVKPSVSLSPLPDLQITVDVNAFWRLETTDGVYDPAGDVIRAPNGSSERFVGSAASLSMTYELAPNLEATAIYAHFEPGAFVSATGPSRDIDFLEVTFAYKF